MRHVRVAEQHLNPLGSISSAGFEDRDPFLQFPQPRVGGKVVAPLRPIDAIEGRGNFKKPASNFEINPIEHGASSHFSGHGVYSSLAGPMDTSVGSNLFQCHGSGQGNQGVRIHLPGSRIVQPLFQRARNLARA
jgi:hypothetical protein